MPLASLSRTNGHYLLHIFVSYPCVVGFTCAISMIFSQENGAYYWLLTQFQKMTTTFHRYGEHILFQSSFSTANF